MSEAEYDLNLPLEEEARSLKIRDVVYLTGEDYTIRDMACNRILNTLSSDEALPFDLNGKAIWHCSPITKPEGKRWEPVPGGSTTISRFTGPAAQLVGRLRIRLAVGKGSMDEEALTTLSKHGVPYIITTGGAAEYYACQIEEVKAVHCLVLGIPSAVWVFKVKRVGPLILAMDSKGGSIFEEIRSSVDNSINRIFKDLEIDPKRNYIWWPNP